MILTRGKDTHKSYHGKQKTLENQWARRSLCDSSNLSFSARKKTPEPQRFGGFCFVFQGFASHSDCWKTPGRYGTKSAVWGFFGSNSFTKSFTKSVNCQSEGQNLPEKGKNQEISLSL